MRIHAAKLHPDYYGGKFFGSPEIRVNGDRVSFVIEADDEAGYAVVLDRDENGRFKRDGGLRQTATKRLEGKVEITGNAI